MASKEEKATMVRKRVTRGELMGESDNGRWHCASGLVCRACVVTDRSCERHVRLRDMGARQDLRLHCVCKTRLQLGTAPRGFRR